MIGSPDFTNSVATTQRNAVKHIKLLNNNSYIPINNCVFNHLVTNIRLSHLEKLYYLVADSLAIINHRFGKKRTVALACRQWAARLNCSRSKVFELQKSLEGKGYFIISKDKNESRQNKRNIIIPTLPQKVFDDLCTTAKNKREGHLPFDAFQEYRRAYLDRTKLYLKFNYQIVKHIVTDIRLNSFQKILWLDLYSKALISKKEKANSSFGIADYFSITSYQELSLRYSCSNKHISKSVKLLQSYGLLDAKRFLIKKGEDYLGNERQDKSLWKITLTISEIYGFVKEEPVNDNNVHQNRTQPNESYIPTKVANEGFKNIAVKKEGINIYPDFVKSGLLLNKSFKINNNRSTEIENSSNPETATSVKKESRSNFSKNNLEKGKKGSDFLARAKELKDFYPLNETDSVKLNKLSGRRFDLNVMNEILRNMASRLKDKFFKTHQAFMNYMAKVFANEIRREEKVNNINFKIITKGSEEERVREREKFLTEIENSLEISPEWHFKKRLASVLCPDKAYGILKAYKSINVEEGVFTLELKEFMELSSNEREIILSHAKSTHDEVVVNDEVKIFVKELRISMPEKQNSKVGMRAKEYKPILENNIWGKIREALIDIYGARGKAIDMHWISKLSTNIDEKLKRLTLIAPSNFIESYVSQNYLHHIQRLGAQTGFSIGLACRDQLPYYSRV